MIISYSNIMGNNTTFGPIDSPEMITESGKSSHKKGVMMAFITVVVLLLAVGGYIILSNPSLKSQMKETLKLSEVNIEQNTDYEKVEVFESDITDRMSPWIEVRGGEADAMVGKDYEVTVYGYSGGKDITGYDMLLGVDHEMFDVISVSSKSDAFQIFSFDKGTHSSVTGIKNIQVTEPTIFDETPLVSIILRPKMKGEGLLTVTSTKDKEKTQFVDNEVNVIIPQIGSIFITVK